MRWLIAAAAIAWAGQSLASQAKPVGSPADFGYQPIGADEKGIWAQADDIERELKNSKLLVRDEKLTSYLTTVLCREVGADRCKAARIYLVREPIFNAGMYANGMLTIFTGALLRIRNEAQLAAILGHEFGHFEARHGLAGMRSQRSTASWVSWLTVVSIGAGQYQDFGTVFWANHYRFSRDQERDADFRGIQDMGRSGYRTACASQIWAGLRNEADATAIARGARSLKDSPKGLFASHPMDAERMLYLADEATKVGIGNAFDGETEYNSAISHLWPMLIDDQIKLSDFGGSEFLLASLATNGWTGPLLFARGELYRSRGSPIDIQQSAVYYREATAMPDAPALAWRGLGLSLARTGDRPGAKLAINEYLKRNPQAGDKPMLLMIAGETQ
ncbi:M48 family metallopeptidase [Sphingomonas sp.]|uniref:M48 family metallopeptidase n=1 Tax=Sphingomonas sp. TaxID=28214 RepID=UPI002600FAB5|nr:M48 family metallopeptidase [Sphingomonas sp.]